MGRAKEDQSYMSYGDAPKSVVLAKIFAMLKDLKKDVKEIKDKLGE